MTTFKFDMTANKSRDELAGLFKQRSRHLAAATRQAENLAIALHDKHYPEVENWEPEFDLVGLLLQIDNMTAGMSVSGEPSEAKDES